MSDVETKINLKINNVQNTIPEEEVTCGNSCKLNDLKSFIKSSGTNDLIFFHKNVLLDDDAKISDYNIHNNSLVQFITAVTIEEEPEPLPSNSDFCCYENMVLQPYVCGKDTRDMSKMKDMLRQVAAFVRIGSHVNIVKFEQVFKRIKEGRLPMYYVATEYLEAGSIEDMYKDRNRGLSEDEAFKVMRQVLEALQEMHNQRVLHRNLKCSNILIADINCLTVKISDLSKSKFYLDPSEKLDTGDISSKGFKKSSVAWFSPEMLLGKEVGKPSDVWMIGATMIEMMEGKTPFQNLEYPKLIETVSNGKIPHSPQSKIVEAFLRGCLQANPNDRMLTSHLLTILG